jgi:GNAT superfamily N-acetyltransferase
MGRWRVHSFVDDAHPDGVIVDKPGDTSSMYRLWTAEVDDDGHAVVRVNPLSNPGTVDCWFVIIEDRTAPEPTATLVAFATDHLRVGTVITDPEFFHLPVANADQVAAVRWWTQTGAVDQIYVAEKWRGRDQARELIYHASAYHQHRGWPGRMHIDGRRTKAGQGALGERRHPNRIAPLEHLLAPLDAPAGTPAPSPDGIVEPPPQS